MPPSDARRDARSLARRLPDLPRWAETPSMLLSGDCEVLGLEVDDGPSFVVVDAPEVSLISIVGTPAPDAVLEAAALAGDGCDVLTCPGNHPHVAAVLAGWTGMIAVLHQLADDGRLPTVPTGFVSLLSPR